MSQTSNNLGVRAALGRFRAEFSFMQMGRMPVDSASGGLPTLLSSVFIPLELAKARPRQGRLLAYWP